MNKRKTITVFEHDSVLLEHKYNGVCFTDEIFEACKRFYGEKGLPYFSLLNNGIRMKEYVGIISIGNVVIEVLPKADKNNDEMMWRRNLINMLRVVHGFELKTTDSSPLKIVQDSILDFYIEYFVKEVEFLLNKGLVKKYRKTDNNAGALKGSLLFPQHIRENLVHKEKFFVRYTTYDVEHLLHFILFKTIILISRINTCERLKSRISSLMLLFPSMPDIKVNEKTFGGIIFNRKTKDYKKAVGIARMLLLNYHPDLIAGRNDVLALLFDMNNLWEKFVYVSLRRLRNKGFVVEPQKQKGFWRASKDSAPTPLRPDIKIEQNGKSYICDTKWKLINSKPSVEDLRQMFAYHHYFDAVKTALIYPGQTTEDVSGYFVATDKQVQHPELQSCLMFIQINDDVKKWQEEICNKIREWVETS